MDTPALDPVAYVADETIDVVDRIYGSGHHLYCNYVPEYSASGLIYCRTCTSQIGNFRSPNMDIDNYQVLKNPRRNYYAKIL